MERSNGTARPSCLKHDNLPFLYVSTYRTCIFEHMARTSIPVPRNSYPDWPIAPVADPEHEKIRQAMCAAQEHIANRFMSVREAARHLGMGHAVLNSALTGRAWPSAMTIARMELGLGANLWPDNELSFPEAERRPGGAAVDRSSPG